MEDSRLVKEVVFGDMEGKTNKGRPKREYLDDVKLYWLRILERIEYKAVSLTYNTLHSFLTP